MSKHKVTIPESVYLDYLIEGPLDGLEHRIREEVLDRCPNVLTTTIRIEVEPDYEQTHVVAKYERPQTPSEIERAKAARERSRKAAAKRKAKQAEKERKEYERLKKKFEGA